MTTRLASVLSSGDLPEAELCAASLDGELYRLGAGFCLIDEIDDSIRRAQSMVTAIGSRLIAEQRTVAWVLGLVGRPPRPLELCTRSVARQRAPSPTEASVREVVIGDDELRSLSGLLMTSPLRTAVDLARFSDRFGSEERSIVLGLAHAAHGQDGFTLADCLAAMDRRRNLPLKRRAIERLASSLR